MSENRMSGGPIEPFPEGWALIPFVGERAHYWRETVPGMCGGVRVRNYRSMCGLKGETARHSPALEPGNWPKCKRCERKA